MEYADLGLIVSVLAGAASIIWQASRIKASVDTHGNAIGEMKRRMDANDKAVSAHLREHHGRISKLEGRG